MMGVSGFVFFREAITGTRVLGSALALAGLLLMGL